MDIRIYPGQECFYYSGLLEQLEEGENLTVVLTRISGNDFLNKLYHNQTTFFIEKELRKYENVATILVPYFYNKSKYKKSAAKKESGQ